MYKPCHLAGALCCILVAAILLNLDVRARELQLRNIEDGSEHSRPNEPSNELLARVSGDQGSNESAEKTNLIHDTRTSVTTGRASPVTIGVAKRKKLADPEKSRKDAERLWNDQQGLMWMQHARKAGGTTLCMTLRYNAVGLVVHERTELPTKRETCQIGQFCFNCDLKDKYPDPKELHTATVSAMHEYHRNFIEFEANGAPVDMLEDHWSDFVFVSTMRHPLERIVSSLKNDPDLRCKSAGNVECMSKFITTEAIQQRCSQGKGIYYCHSNYFVRMFSGMDKVWTTDEDMMQRAKKNFHRFSCVILQEEWDETSVCLRKLGLYRSPEKQFNVAGRLSSSGLNGTSATKLRKSNEFSLLRKQEQDILIEVNQLDLEFYEWSRNIIISDARYNLDS